MVHISETFVLVFKAVTSHLLSRGVFLPSFSAPFPFAAKCPPFNPAVRLECTVSEPWP